MNAIWRRRQRKSLHLLRAGCWLRVWRVPGLQEANSRVQLPEGNSSASACPAHDSFLFNSETREDIKAFYMRLNEDRPKWSTEKA